MKINRTRILQEATYKLLLILLISFFVQPDNLLRAQPLSAGDEQLAAIDVVETAVEDIGFLLTLHDKVSGNAGLLRQLKEDYFPLFDQQLIARQVLKSRFSYVSNVRSEYLECLVGLTFFNAHLDAVSQKSGAQKQFDIDRSDPSTNNLRVKSVDVTMTQGEQTYQFAYRLVNRQANSTWRIADIKNSSGRLLANLRTGLQEIHTAAINQDIDAYKHAARFLIRHNDDAVIDASQWCKPPAEDPIEAESAKQLSQGDGKGPFEVTTTLNGQTQNVFLEVTPDGTVLYQSDIILGLGGDIEAALSGLDFRKLRLWRDATVPYLIDDTVPDRELVQRAIEEWDKKTPVRFVEAGSEDDDLLHFTGGLGCRSSLGMIGGRQFITLSSKCSYGAVLHEIGHALGLIHEHNRKDRDNFITIKLRNVLYEKEHNFYKHSSTYLVSDAYCFGSIMHYSQHAFAISPDLKTIEVKGRSKIGQRKRLSSCDASRIHELYAPLAKSSIGNRTEDQQSK